ncbi:MAG: arylsulfatase [Phycisphaerae bacterium]|nr:arylsulfatase [Phycisphaerae bacterium]
MNRRNFLKAAALAVVASGCAGNFPKPNKNKPNIILIMADDMGYSDIGCFGAEIKTPNLDKLGFGGKRFTQFYSMAKCNPTRSALLTGLFMGKKNAANAIPLAKQLSKAGYYTAMSGKEHFDGWVPKSCYAENAFDDSFKYWAINTYFAKPDGKFSNKFKLNGNVIEEKDLPVNNPPLYKTDLATDYGLEFLDNAKKADKPFFLYMPYHVAHYPLQARDEDIAKYRGKYKKGWDVIRQERFERQKQLGVIGKDYKLSPPEDNINKFRGPYRNNIYKYRQWDSLDENEQNELDLEMAVFAAMVDRMDQNIGRLLNKLDEMKVRDNTLIMFLCDNGSCPYDSNKDFSIPPGPAESYRSLCAAWANVGNTPFRYYKQYGHEGGAKSNFIANWPGIIKSGFCHDVSHLVDIYPTLLDITATQYLATVKNKPMPRLDGNSMLPLFKGQNRNEPEIIISGYSDRFRMVRFADWKIVKVNGGPWQLYNLQADPTELNNLADAKKEKVKELERKYNTWLKNNGITTVKKKKIRSQ